MLLRRNKLANHLALCRIRSSGSDTSLASQEIPHILQYPKLHYRVQNSQPLISLTSQNNPVHNLSFYLFKTHFNIIILSTPKSSKQSLYFRFSHHTPAWNSIPFDACHIPCPSHPLRFDHAHSICRSWQCSISIFSSVSPLPVRLATVFIQSFMSFYNIRNPCRKISLTKETKSLPRKK